MSATPPRDETTNIIRPAGSGTTAPSALRPTTVAGEPRAPQNVNTLPVGTSLGEFEIKGLIGQGGFSLVYLAYDHSLRREVALKEYMPSAFAARGGGTMVAVLSEKHSDTFKAGLRSFINEAHLLAQFDHPALVKVYRFWEANGTAYMAMPFYQAITLKETLRQFDGPPSEAWLKSFLVRILDILEVIHAKQCFHRDIAPDNVLMLDGTHPLLLDFGAARRVIGDMTQALTVILKPGFAPIEQYGDSPSMTQGPWTDIYALAAVVNYSITGQIPPPAVVRLMADNLIPLSRAAVGKYSDRFLAAIDKALAVKPEDRPQTAAQFRALLGLETEGDTPHRPSSNPAPQGLPSTQTMLAQPLPRSPLLAYVAGTLALVLIVTGFFVFMHQKNRAEKHAVLAPAPSAERVTPIVTPVGQAIAPVQPTPEPVPVAASTPVATPAPTPAPTEKSSDPVQVLGDIFNGRDRQHEVAVSVRKAQVVIGKDRLRFSIISSTPGYVYVLMLGSERTHFELIFPNAIDKNNLIEPGMALELPRPGSRMVAGEPAGKNEFLVMVSDWPRDFGAAGMKSASDYAQVAVDTVLRSAYVGGVPALAGKAVCPKGKDSACSTLFGAATFAIEGIHAPLSNIESNALPAPGATVVLPAERQQIGRNRPTPIQNPEIKRFLKRIQAERQAGKSAGR
ncbi:MAG: serine/threonine-protein kinase [Pseudomonadota bacterium]